MRSVVISLLLVIIYVSITRAATMGVRAYLGCSLVKNQIHCFGGYTGVDSESSSIYQNPSADHFYLDMSTFNFNDTSTAMSNWTITKDSATLEATGFVQATSMANQSKLLLYGGTSPTGSNLLNPFMMYDPVSGNWDSVTTYGNYTRFGSFVNLDDTQKVWTWGGVFNATWNVTSYAYTLSFQTLLWEPIAGDTANTYTRYQHSSTLVPSKNTIYILGGMNRNLEPGKVDFGADMLEVRTFNTMTSSWGTLHATVSNGQNITPRNFHTATPITNTTVFLIYGGDASDTRNTAVLNDYAYLFDYSNNVYTPVNFDAGIGAGARTGHVAVPYNSYVMIMFGVNSRHELLQDLHVLNMTNVTSPTWLGAPVPSPISDNINSGPSELSPGAIAGIVVGAVVASIALTAALIYMMYRKRKQRKEFELEKTDPRRMSLTESMILTDKQQEDYYNGSKLQSPTIQRYSIPATRTVINGVTTTISNDHSVYSSSSPISPAFNEPIKPFFPGEESNRVKPDGDC